MKYRLVDNVIELMDDRILAVKQVSLAEEYLADHFPSFPVLPGVMMIEAMAQAARHLLARHGDGRLVLGEVRALKFSNMVRPGEQLVVEVAFAGQSPDGHFSCKGTGRVRRSHSANSDGLETAVSGKFTMRPIQRG